ncbi:eosinophil peroxidase-like isoform X2 [Tachypleus tridentatus]|uniref:eosinophil peroxidase-like isoform X2 n=1 Tax=Tachypleus tridentatus TaxID=6853 RepID=UPI003FD02BBA
MQFAQFVDHDLTFTPMNQGPLGLVLNCKDCESGLTVHPECFPIHIPKNDPFYSAVNLNTGQANCISSVRSLPGQLKLGDTCASEQPGLTVLHTVFLREHNRIVENLPRLNQHWSDEDLYNSGRRILSAVIQHMIYNEFLPHILSWETVINFKLKLESEGYYKSYSPS